MNLACRLWRLDVSNYQHPGAHRASLQQPQMVNELACGLSRPDVSNHPHARRSQSAAIARRDLSAGENPGSTLRKDVVKRCFRRRLPKQPSSFKSPGNFAESPIEIVAGLRYFKWAFA